MGTHHATLQRPHAQWSDEALVPESGVEQAVRDHARARTCACGGQVSMVRVASLRAYPVADAAHTTICVHVIRLANESEF
jgi:hypothetical protein